MSDPNAASAPAPAGSGWTPKETINVMIGKQNTNVYPRVQPLWPIEERAYAYHVTKTALQSLHLPTDVYLDNLGMYLDSQTTVAGLKCDFLEYFEDHWLDMGNLTILSFHTSAGAVLDASIPGDINVLRPVQNGAVANCCPADVRYVRLECVLDYADLAEHAGPNDNTILRRCIIWSCPKLSLLFSMAIIIPATSVRSTAPPTSAPSPSSKFKMTFWIMSLKMPPSAWRKLPLT
jgi:hypothetical protein